MFIAYVTETWPPEVNGVALTTARTVRWLRERNHFVDLIRPRQPGEEPIDRAGELTVPGMAIPVYRALRFGLPVHGLLHRRWLQRRPEVVHVATEGPLAASAVSVALRLGIPVTSDFRTDFHQYCAHYDAGWVEPIARAWLRRLHNRCALTFVPTPTVQAALAAEGFERLAVVGRGVDAACFTPERRSESLRRRWGVRPQDPVVLHVGRLAAEKNVELVLRAFLALRTMAPIAPMARLVWIGEGPMRERLTLPGPIAVFAGVERGTVLARSYASADLFLFPSLTDTYGNVVPEALASGLSVAAFDRGAAVTCILDGDNGFKASGDSDVAFMRAAGAALAGARPGSRVRQRARESIALLDWDRVLVQFESALRRVSGEAAPFVAVPGPWGPDRARVH